MKPFVFVAAAMIAAASVAHAAEPAAAAIPVPAQHAAMHSAAAQQSMILAVTHAGKRIVAVGDGGAVLLSDDGGKSFRQAKSVPVRVTLNAVSFSDEHNGWIAGHWGVILHSGDGGETWTRQRDDRINDRPLFSIYFKDGRHGWAVGLWSLMLATEDGGKTWSEIKLDNPPDGGKADRNLFGIFSDRNGTLYILAERGAVLRSEDAGKTWTYQLTGYKGSFWTGLALDDGSIVVAGLRGTIYRSSDRGQTWSVAHSNGKSSITDLIQVGDKVQGVGLDGLQIESADHGANFVATQRSDRLPLTALTALSNGGLLRFSKTGVVR